MYSLCCLSPVSLEEKMSNVAGYSTGIMTQDNFMIELFFLFCGCLGKVTCGN